MHQVGLNEYVEIGTGDPIESENLMEFRLLFRGELLPSGGSNSRASEKHQIRRSFHPQLKRLWKLQPNLVDYVQRRSLRTNPESRPIEERFDLGVRAIGREWNRLGFNFVPLVTEELVPRCSLDILLLRPGDQQFIFRQGDIDGQLNTLFDALKIPESFGSSSALPENDEDPFYCLLQDDRLISEVKVTSDELLLLPGERELKANDAFAVISVKVNHKSARTFDNIFG